ncbi:hypothetical protein BREVNS_1059 [Brevinematales bacterium NS]|nr:hypothetical protein BREVNS_1059 [Brevinematales bacterium NS]
MKKVNLSFFSSPVVREGVERIVIHPERHGNPFSIGFLPKEEFSYEFSVAPDILFEHLNIKEVYYEPYRTFIVLDQPTTLEIVLLANTDKLIVKER